MGGAPAPAPTGGASDVPPAPMDAMGAPAPDDGGMNGGAPAGGDGMLDPNMGGEPPMDGSDMGGEPPMDGPEGGDDSTMSLFNQLSDEDKEAARGYIESMLSRDETQDAADEMGGEPMPPQDGGPMMESFIFSKKQIKSINENLLPTEPEEKDDKQLEKRKGQNLTKKSPFKSPKFN